MMPHNQIFASVPMPAKRQFSLFLREKVSRHAVWVALLLLLALCASTSPAFRNPQNLLNISRQISYSGIIALGMTFVIISGGIDLSVGSLLALSGTLAIMAMNSCQDPVRGVALGLLAALVSGACGGALNGLLVTGGGITPFIATLGTMSIFRSLALFLAKAGETRSEHELFSRIGGAELLTVPLPTLIFLLLVLAGFVLLQATAFGRHVCAVGANERVARFAAIRIGRVKFATYIMCGLLTGISAFLLGGRLNSIMSGTAGNAYELDGIAAAIIGGTAMSGGRGSIPGTLAGALILGIVSNALDMWGISAYLQGAVKGLVIIVAVLLQRQRQSQP